MYFINLGLKENAYGTMPMNDLLLTLHTRYTCMCVWDFQPQSSPSVAAHSVPCFYWSRWCCGEKNNRNFICHWLSPLTVVSDVFYIHSTHRHTHTQRRAAVLTNVTNTLPSLLPRLQYSNGHTVEFHQDPHRFCVCFRVFFSCMCVSMCLFWV